MEQLSDEKIQEFINSEKSEIDPLRNYCIAMALELKERREAELPSEQYPDTEADGVIFCGKCGKKK